MKSTLKLLLLLSISTPVHAEYFKDNYIFGTSYIQQYADLKAARGSASDTGNGFGIYLDKYIKHQYRVNSSLAYVFYDTFDIVELMLSADYLIPVRTTVSAFIGVSTGVGTQKFADASLNNSATGSISGVQLGVIKYIDNTHLLEIGFRKRNTNIKTILETIPESHVSIDSLDEAYISLLFMF